VRTAPRRSSFYDGKNPPKKIESLATLDDGKEFQRYFGRPARAKP
jgi:hypothetical protein